MAGKLCLLGLLGFVTPRLAAAQDDVPNPCVVNGVDFQEGGTYFQDSESSDPFSFVQYFEGCQNDTAQNLLVGPAGDVSEQVQCSDTPMQPNDAPQDATCPTLKSQLVSGDWSILIMSNNGDADPIAYQRDFHLEVGPQITTTTTLTATVTEVYTPIINATVTETNVIPTTLPASTTTVASVTKNPTRTITPAKVTVTTTNLYTINKVKPTPLIIKTTKVVTPKCSIPPRPTWHDKKARITPTLPGLVWKHPKRSAAPADSYFRFKERAVPYNQAEFVAKRRAHLANIAKRAPDSKTVILTDPTVATATTTITTDTFTVTSAVTVDVTSTVTPPVVTIASGKTVVFTTVTAPGKTRTVTKYSVVRNTTTKIFTKTLTYTSTASAGPSASACRKRGGWWH